MAKPLEPHDRPDSEPETEAAALGPRQGLARVSRRSLLTAGAAAALLGLADEGEAATVQGAADGLFTAADLPILQAVLGAVPHLASVAAVLKLARMVRLRYPVASHASLQRSFARLGSSARAAGHDLTWDAVRRYLPVSFFPIVSETDLLMKLLIAFQRADFDHAYERTQRRMRRAQLLSDTELPAPAVVSDEPIWVDNS